MYLVQYKLKKFIKHLNLLAEHNVLKLSNNVHSSKVYNVSKIRMSVYIEST